MVEQIADRSVNGEAEADALVRELELERARLGRELHAGVGQPLAGMRLNLDILDSFSHDLPAPALDALNRLERLVEEALAQTRALAHRLHPPAWQLLPIGDALGRLVDSSGIASRMQVVLDFDDGLIEPSHPVRVAIYRCVQECLSNTIRHSGATRFELSLRRKDASPLIELTVRDNGNGMIREGNGIGLASIREHAESVGGAASVSSNQPGTLVVVSLPVGVE